MQLIHNGGVTSPQGFLAAGMYCGIKKSKKKDLALIYSMVPAAAAGVFTANKVKAAPVVLCQRLIKQKKNINYLVINSGNANCSTGALGMKNAIRMAEAAGQPDSLAVMPARIASVAGGAAGGKALVASTGVIGHQLPMDIICKGIKQLKNRLSKSGGADAAAAILTTDKVVKRTAVKIQIGGKTVTLGAMAKGSGMIYPNLATMIGAVTTDANISPNLLQTALKNAVKNTFNMISVDGDMSTNDTVLVLANGKSETPQLKAGTADFKKFYAALEWICGYLAKEIVKDGEGATKIVEIQVEGAGSLKDAVIAARAVANSNLVKTAFFGNDPNWGRIMGALGASIAKFNPDKVDIFIEGKLVAKNGRGSNFNGRLVSKLMAKKEVAVKIDLKTGKCRATAWCCDLTYDYITINAKYHT